MSFLDRMLGKAKISSMDLEVKFHTEANLFGEHGMISVSHIKKNLKERPVRFVFVGHTTPPKMTLRLMAYIWQCAEEQGYIPHHIESYGRENEIIDTNREVEDTTHKITALSAI
jgi:hypothetical protein